MTDDFRALTVKQPHAWAIAAGLKDVENRSWRFWLPLGTTIGIHAGVKDDPNGLTVPVPVPDALSRGALIGLVDVIACTTDSGSRWAIPGQFHWVLANARLLDEPIPMRGHMHLFRVPPSTLARIRASP
jgi:hypothetical protein